MTTRGAEVVRPEFPQICLDLASCYDRSDRHIDPVTLSVSLLGIPLFLVGMRFAVYHRLYGDRGLIRRPRAALLLNYPLTPRAWWLAAGS